jgi:hypothetical protein
MSGKLEIMIWNIMFKSGLYAIYENEEYSFVFNSDDKTSNLYSLDEKSYPSIKRINIEEIKIAYNVRTWMVCKGCHAVWEGNTKEGFLLGVRPSKDVDILGAKEVDRGVYMAEVDKGLIEGIYEERFPQISYAFPSDLELKKEIPLSVLNS